MSNNDLIEVIAEDNNENIVEREDKRHRSTNSQHSAKLFEEAIDKTEMEGIKEEITHNVHQALEDQEEIEIIKEELVEEDKDNEIKHIERK